MSTTELAAILEKKDAFNAAHPVGTTVRYWIGKKAGEGTVARTTGPASAMSGRAVVYVEGRVGRAVELALVEVVEREPTPSPELTPAEAFRQQIARDAAALAGELQQGDETTRQERIQHELLGAYEQGRLDGALELAGLIWSALGRTRDLAELGRAFCWEVVCCGDVIPEELEHCWLEALRKTGRTLEDVDAALLRPARRGGGG